MDTYNNTKDTKNSDKIKIEDRIKIEKASLLYYSHQPDFRRCIIKGSVRAQRRKITIFELFRANVHSPLFLDRINKYLFFFLILSN